MDTVEIRMLTAYATVSNRTCIEFGSGHSTASLARLCSKGVISFENKVCIHGVSYGGYASLQAVVKEPDLYQCSIPDAGTYELTVDLENCQLRDQQGWERSFEVDPSRREKLLPGLDDIGQTLWISLINLNVEAVDIGEFFEKNGFTFHHWLGGKRTNIA